MKQTCPGCQTEGEGKSGTVADNKPPGWAVTTTYEGGCLFFCSGCSKTLGDHARAILEITKDDYIYFPSLVKMGVDVVEK